MVHYEKYTDYTAAEIDELWAEREESELTKRLLEENGLPSLAHVFFEVGSRDALLAGRRFVGLDRHLLQQVLPFGNLARNAARGAKKAQHGDS